MNEDIDDSRSFEPGATAPEVAAGLSVVDRVVKRRAARELDAHWFDIPSWGGEMQARMNVVEKDDLEAMVRRVRARQVAARNGRRGGNAAGQKVENTGNNADLDFLIKACSGIRAVDMETLEEQELPVSGFRDWETLKEMLKDPEEEDEEKVRLLESVSSARDMTAYMIGHNEIALMSWAGRIASWMQDTSKVEDPS